MPGRRRLPNPEGVMAGGSGQQRLERTWLRSLFAFLAPALITGQWIEA